MIKKHKIFKNNEKSQKIPYFLILTKIIEIIAILSFFKDFENQPFSAPHYDMNYYTYRSEKDPKNNMKKHRKTGNKKTQPNLKKNQIHLQICLTVYI